MEEFKKLGIDEAVLKVIEEVQFQKPTEIQQKTIPLVLQKKDVIAGSATGSGKTLAFGVGILASVEKHKGIQALVLTPTRELTDQVKTEIKKFAKYRPLRIISIYGGVSINPQFGELQSCEVVVATPGRLADHLRRNTIDLSKVKVLVLDEADRMFDMGFIDDVKFIVSRCPAHRQTLLFSATIYPEIAQLARQYMKDPIKVSAEKFVDPKKLKQVYYDTPKNIKLATLVHLLKNEKSGLVMVFCNTRRNVDFVARNLKGNGVHAQAIHGGFSQAKRTQTMERFHAQQTHVLVCTDVAARGLDIPHVSHIYNYDLPPDGKEYIHRIGRTARAGKEGKVINLLSEDSHDNFSRVLRENDVEITKENRPYVEPVKVVKAEFVEERPSYGRRSFGPRGPRRSGPRRSYHQN
ncbi:MAG TPA: DEAD/DEAH box helicase [Candidatus Nanoarchaeia archaeon]|nr:DEAD/DEAH box helicase [Candidatus Nanoarchaeia archaeon]